MNSTEEIQLSINNLQEKGKLSDGYHTFDELYDHRITLYIALCKTYSINDGYPRVIGSSIIQTDKSFPVWRSKKHSDGSGFEGWFILGIYQEKGKQITYHLPICRWEECKFAETLDKAPDWDGHSSQDVLNRIKNLES